MPITVPIAFMPGGYSIEGERGGSPKAIVTYLCNWSDAFTLYNELLGFPTASIIGPITFASAHQFPPSPQMYASRARIEPIGAGEPIGTSLGLSPGEFFRYAKVTCEYEVPPYQQ